MTPVPPIAVAVSTHNPRREVFARCLEGLRRQTLPTADWEFVIVDNSSTPALQTWVDLSWHPAGRIVVEEKLGLAFARCRGFAETRAPLVVNVDDDNVLEKEYLAKAIPLAARHPHIGVFGGQNDAEFEIPPVHPPEHYYGAVRTVKESIWSNLRENSETTPWGAGSVVRREVANRYLQRIAQDPRLLELGRRGQALFSCEDIDIANSACDLGLGKGVFVDLHFTHLIPAKRMTDDFKVTNAYWNHYSAIIHNFLQYGGRLPPPRSWPNRIQMVLRSLFRDRLTRRMMFGQVRAERDAVAEIKRRGWL